MKFLINSSSAVPGSSLHLKISGFSIELSDISGSGKVAVVEDSGKISIEVLPVVETLPSIDEDFIPAIDNKQSLEKASLSENIQGEKSRKSL